MALLQQSTGAQEPLRVFGVRLVGLTPETGRKLVLSIVFIIVILALSWGIKFLLRLAERRHQHDRVTFWLHQAISILFVVLLVIGLASIWFSDPARLASVLGLVTAGVAIALQRVITAFAAYLIILRGRIFNIGDRITIGGVRGDVVRLGFMQTSVMEMGQSPPEQSDEPAMWVHARQYTGRLVRITNDKIFDEPVYNYTREFPFFWEEIQIPIAYRDDRKGVEQILLQVAERNTRDVVASARPALERLRRRYLLPGAASLEPAVYHRLTDNWVELTLRFVTPVHGVRGLKDRMYREILAALDEKQIGIASSTFEVVGVPRLHVVTESSTHPGLPGA